jgi:hypothetical protein
VSEAMYRQIGDVMRCAAHAPSRIKDKADTVIT